MYTLLSSFVIILSFPPNCHGIGIVLASYCLPYISHISITYMPYYIHISIKIYGIKMKRI